MGKTANCIKMLQLLNTGKTYKISELAEALETNPRNVIEYRTELEEAGYVIVGVPGKYGGYKLDRTGTIPTLKLTEEDKLILMHGASYLESSDFLERKSYESVMSKIFSSMNYSVPMQDTFIIPGVTLSMPSEELLARYQTIEQCIKSKRVLHITFLSNENIPRERDIHPYKLFMLNNAWFVLAYCEFRQKVLPFKLNRILEFSETTKKFRIPLYYNEREELDKMGLKKGGDWSSAEDSGKHDWYHVKLKFSGRPAMYVREYVYGQNQVVTTVDTNTTLLECDMQYKYNTIRFVLQFGADCEVLEPLWLKEEVQLAHQKALEKSK